MSGALKFEVAGRLVAIGSQSQPIEFKREAANTLGWDGIYFLDNLRYLVLRHVHISGATNSGLRILNSTPILQNCRVFDNRGVGGGLDISLTTPLALKFEDTIVETNDSTSAGGGIRASLAAGSSLTLKGCTITGNVANVNQYGGDYAGGGVWKAGDGSLTIERSHISQNTVYSKTTTCNDTAIAYGGGCHLGGGTTTIEASVISENVAYALDVNSCCCEHNLGYGAGVSLWSGTLWIRDSVLSNNDGYFSGSNPWGSGFYVNSGIANIINCTIAYNDGVGLENAGATVSAVNSIFYFNTRGQIGGTVSVTYSDVQGGHAGEGNFSANPSFISPPTDLRLADGSFCIDLGNNSAQNMGWRDIDGNPRILDGDCDGSLLVDVGADEYRNSNCVPTPSLSVIREKDGGGSLEVYGAPNSLGGDTGLAVVSDPDVGSAVLDIASVNFDADPEEEFLVVRQEGGGVYSLWIHDYPLAPGGDTGPALASDPNIGKNIVAIAAGNADSDPEDELWVIRRKTNGYNELLVYDLPGMVGGDTGPAIASDWGMGTGIVQIAAGNVDADSDDELFCVRVDESGAHSLQIYNLPVGVGGETGYHILSDSYIGTNTVDIGVSNVDADAEEELWVVRLKMDGVNNGLLVYDIPTRNAGEIGGPLLSDWNFGKNVTTIAGFAFPVE